MVVTENLSAPWDGLGVMPDLPASMVFGGLLPVSPGQSQQPIAWEKGVNGCGQRSMVWSGFFLPSSLPCYHSAG